MAMVGKDSIKGMDDAPSYSYAINGLSTASNAVACQSAMDGNNGSWAVIYGSGAISANEIKLAVDEDQAKDPESYDPTSLSHLATPLPSGAYIHLLLAYRA